MSAPSLGIDAEVFGSDIIPAIEKSFGIQFEQNDFEEVSTYGDLCSTVRSKLNLASVSTCTTQQAFYKLRLALQAHGVPATIGPTSLLEDALPAQWFQRRRAVNAIQQVLGMELNILKMPEAVESFFAIMVLLSVVGIPVAGLIIGSRGATICALGFVAAIMGLMIGSWLGNTIRYTTIGEIVSAMSSQYYRQSRRDPSSVNQTEINHHLSELFSYHSGIEVRELTSDALLAYK
ncbi:hypothetical protein I2I05_15865 [Hymenobacter sp. BT683]|uniref:Acyl carrier protein n=1 Tax=Hymenobacter jeongseonensis TaxID=2791027 RepID=A0ABS0IM70_9BACT|nr:hypothetical protein [Hymenobacter jeongseonensis]MBF9238880.1 hypothetical protein [Hymenobacter jeongseonensis]